MTHVAFREAVEAGDHAGMAEAVGSRLAARGA